MPIRFRLLKTLILGTLIMAACKTAPHPDPAPSPGATSAPAAARVPDLWVIDIAPASPAEQMLALTLQGLANRRGPRVWIKTDGMSALILDQLAREGTRLHAVADAWALYRLFHDEVAGAIVYQIGTDSVNVATSLCGPKQAVAVDESLLGSAAAAGLKVVFDARGYDELRAYAEFKAVFTHGVAVEQVESKTAHLRDYAVFRSAFTFYGLSQDDSARIVRELGPGTFVFGWGGDENRWVQQTSQGGGTGVPADWSRNLSALAQMPAALAARPHRAPRPVKAGERIVAFVMSDGDNIQWMAGGFATSPAFWASPRRGAFDMTWEMAPILAQVAPRALDTFYRTASAGAAVDDFVTGPSGAGYSYHNALPDRAAFAGLTAQLLRESSLSVVTMLNSGGDMRQADELLDRTEVLGVLYKDYAPYNAQRGRIYWRNGKPAVSYRFLLWEPLRENSPEGVAAAIAKLPADPASDPNSYAIINVHAWSFESIGGPMEAVKRTLDLLPPGTRVTTAEELITLLRQNFGAP